MYRVRHVEYGNRGGPVWVTMNFREYENAVFIFYSRVLDTAVRPAERPTLKKSEDGTMVASFVKERIFHHLDPIRFED